MAGILGASILNTAQSKISAKFQKPEVRRFEPSITELALTYQDFAIPNPAILRTSPLRPVTTNWFKKIANGTATSKAYNHTGDFGDTGVTTIQYIQIVETIGIPYKVGANNVFDQQEQFNNALEQKIKANKERQDAAALAFLLSNKCQLSQSTMSSQIAAAGFPAAAWNDTTFSLEIGQTNKALFMQKVKDFMKSRLFSGELDIVADIQSMSNFLNFMNQGGGNFQKTDYQFGDATYTPTERYMDANYTAGSVFAMPKGIFAGLNWNEQLNRDGGIPNQTLNNEVGILTTMKDPFGGKMTFDISMYTQRADTTANTYYGNPQDILLQCEITSTIGYVTAPLTVSGDSPINEISLLAS